MDYKQAFLSQLENSYLGVQIQDAKDLFSQDSLSREALKKSGFINLLQMKSKYFQHIKNLLEKEKLNHSIYTKLYNFFSSYLNETGTPFFYDTPMHKNIYAKVYTNSKDTSLFYKTQNLYYVKSDTLYHDAEITSQDSKYTFIFDTSHFIPNADNAKNKAIFKFAIEENIRIYVLNDKESLKELPNVFKQNSSDLSDEFIKSLKDKKIQLQEEEIKKILSSYKKQNEIDFFIHKNARAFLQEQFNLWLCNYVLDDITQWRQEKIEELNTLKKVAFTIIDYIADFEDELKAIWCKPKFAKNVEYVFSLDVILKNSSVEGHSVLSDKSGNLHSDFRSFASSKLHQSSLDNPLFSSQSLECQEDGEKNVSCIADSKAHLCESKATKSQRVNLTQDTRIADTCHSERSEESKTTQAQQSSLRENKQSAVSLENPQDFRGKTSQQRSFFSNLKSSTTESQILLDSIINDKGFESQVKEWQELKLVEEDISLEDMKSIVLSLQKISKESSAICHSKAVTEESLSPRHSELHSSEESKSNTRDSKKDVSGGHPQHDENEKYRYLPLDTKHFSKATKYKILSSFKDIESTLNGELIKSDNFQALNTLLPKYQNKVDLIYIDPPFNTGSDFEYKDKFQDSTWLTLMENRLELAREFLSDRGSFYLHLDHNANYRGRELLNTIFGEENFRNEIVWKRKGGSSNPESQYDIAVDTIYFYSKCIEFVIFNRQYDLTSDEVKKYIKERFNNIDESGRKFLKSPIVSPNYRENLKYDYKGYKSPPNGWSIDISVMKQWDKNNKLYFPKDGDRIYRKIYLDEYIGQPILNLWTDIFVINPVAKERIEFDSNLTQKPEALLARIIKASSKGDSKQDVSGLHPQHDENRHSDSIYRHSDLEQSEREESLVIANEESVTESIKDSSFATQIQNNKIGHNDTASTTGGGGESMPLKCVDSSIVLDFFVGSGTTIATAHKLGRKWLGVEMGEHFYKVIIPRMKKVIGGFVSGISKEVEFKGGGAFRYYELESYEESLANCEYVLDSSLDRESNKDILPTAQYDKAENFQYDRVGGSQYNKTESHQYTKIESHSDKISRHIESPPRHSNLEQSEREESNDTKYSIINYRKSRKLIKGLKKGEAISLDMSGYRENFDILHTMANVLGLKIQRLFLDSKGIECAEFDNGDIVSSDSVDLCKYPKLTNLIWWER